MDLTEIKTYLYEHIPLSKAMEVDVVDASVDKVVLRAPLAPNINHRATVAAPRHWRSWQPGLCCMCVCNKKACIA
jgi:hypothetical protein